MEAIVNKVAESGLITLNLEDFLPSQEVKAFDLKDFLFMGMILKEKDYRLALKTYDFSVFQNSIVAVHCSADAIIPVWAYMLAASYLQPFAYKVFLATPQEALDQFLLMNIESLSTEMYKDQRVVIKGCGEKPISAAAYLAVTNKLLPIVKSIMYGEPCSTVPVYKKK